MLGYLCNWCAHMIWQSRSGELRDCGHCGCPAKFTRSASREEKAA